MSGAELASVLMTTVAKNFPDLYKAAREWAQKRKNDPSSVMVMCQLEMSAKLQGSMDRIADLVVNHEAKAEERHETTLKIMKGVRDAVET